MARHTGTDYGTAVNRSNKMHRPLLLANHLLHWISSLIVMSIAAYFISKFSHNTHLRYWVGLGAVDAFLYLPAMILPAIKKYKGYLAPLAWILSYFWLTAFIFASQDYDFDNCAANSPAGVNKCNLKWTLQAFSFLAFFTNLIGTVAEAKLWDIQRFKHGSHAVGDKHNTGVLNTDGTSATTAPTTTTAAV